MSLIVNNRRRATHHVRTESVNSKPSNAFWEKRKELVNSLSEHERKLLNLYETKDHRTEADVFTVYRCRPVAATARMSVETDIPPQLVAEEIIGLDELQSNQEFGLPTHTIQREPWLEVLPKFSHWLESLVRYPKLNDDKKSILPGVLSQTQTIRQMSLLDQLECYLALFHGTLMEYFYGHNNHYCDMAQKVLHTICRWVKTKCPTYTTTEEKRKAIISALRPLMQQRDASLSDATNYKEYINSLHPADYYLALLHFLKTDPALMHKSRIVNIESLIWGYALCLQSLPSELVLPLPVFADLMLRLFIERGLRSASLPQTPQCTTMDELVAFCHERMGTKIWHTLKNACYMWKTMEFLVRNPTATAESFSQQIHDIATLTNQVESVTGLCVFFNPTTFINDQVLADIWLAACEQKEKFSSLSFAVYETNDNKAGDEKNHNESNIPTPHIDKLLNKIHLSIGKAQEEVRVVREKAKSADHEQIWSHFWNNLEGNHLFQLASMKPFLSLLFACCETGDEQSIERCEYLIEKGASFISKRKLVTFLLRAAPPGPLRDFFYDGHDKTRFEVPPVSRRSWINRFLWTVKNGQHCDYSKLIQADEKQEDDEEGRDHQNTQALVYVPFAVVREMIEGAQKSLDKVRNSECCICFEVSAMVALHNDARHSVCAKCLPKLSHCPSSTNHF